MHQAVFKYIGIGWQRLSPHGNAEPSLELFLIQLYQLCLQCYYGNIISSFHPHSWPWPLSSIFVSIKGTPKHLDYEEVKGDLTSVQGVKQAHSLHIWSLTLNRTALSAHLVLRKLLVIVVVVMCVSGSVAEGVLS